MNNQTKYARDIIALSDTDLETFVRDWINLSTKRGYVETASFSGTGDMGRDVVGFNSADKHNGDWDNYQCKQYGTPLSTATGFAEIGKILYYASKKHFLPPKNIYFVAPRGVNRNLDELIFNAPRMKIAIVDNWDTNCAGAIIKNTVIPMTPELKSILEGFDYRNIHRKNLDDILLDENINPILHRWFGEKLSPPPKGQVPPAVENRELPYIQQLIDAYGEREQAPFPSTKEVIAHNEHGPHLARQRERFYDADAFNRFYRDSIEPEILSDFHDEIYYGIAETCQHSHRDALECVDTVMREAGQIRPSGPLAEHARVQVKQGVCHHMANDGKIKWKK